MSTPAEARQNLIDLLAGLDGTGRFDEGDDSITFESAKSLGAGLDRIDESEAAAAALAAEANLGVEFIC